MKTVTFYLWKLDASTDFMPALAGQVTVTGDRAEVAPTSEKRIHDLVEAFRSKPLALRTETTAGKGDSMKLKLGQIEVNPGHDDWGYALSEAIGREGGYSVTFTPEPA